MEQNVSDRIISIPTVDRDILNALDWKDGIGTLPGSNIQVRNQGTQYMNGHHVFQSICNIFCSLQIKVVRRKHFVLNNWVGITKEVVTFC